MTTAETITIDKAYMIEFQLLSNQILVSDMSGDTAPFHYLKPWGDTVFYKTAYGMWKYTFGDGKWWFAEKDSNEFRPTIIRGCGIPQELKGKYYDAIIEDDMVDAFAYTVSGRKGVMPAIREYNRIMQGINSANPLQPKVKFTNITEGGKDMTKQLYHVILFNRKTEEIDFKAYVPAKSETDASMMAAQSYGKYDSTTHVTIVKYIEGSDYEVVK